MDLKALTELRFQSTARYARLAKSQPMEEESKPREKAERQTADTSNYIRFRGYGPEPDDRDIGSMPK